MANWSKPSLFAGLVAWSFLLVGVSYAVGVSSEKNNVALSNKPLSPSKVQPSNAGIELAKASEYGKAKQFDQVIALLMPEVEVATNDADQRAAGKVLIAQAYFAKADLENALKWYSEANTTSSARLDADLGIANVSSQLYGKTLPTDAAKAATYKATAIQALTQAQGLTTNAAIKTQISTQISSLQKAR